MAIHVKKINGHEYAYDVKTVWDKQAQKYKKQTKYLGTVTDKESKTYERRYGTKAAPEKLILDYGDSYILSETAKSSGLEKVFPVYFQYFVWLSAGCGLLQPMSLSCVPSN